MGWRSSSLLLPTTFGRWSVHRLALSSGIIFFFSVSHASLLPTAGDGQPRLHELLQGSMIYEEPYVPPPKSKELLERLARLEAEQAEREYRRIVGSVDMEMAHERRVTDLRELKVHGTEAFPPCLVLPTDWCAVCSRDRHTSAVSAVVNKLCLLPPRRTSSSRRS